VRFISLNEHGSLTNWMIIGAPLAGLLNRSENLGFTLMVWLSVPFLFSSVVFSVGSSMFSDSRVEQS
jgi:hypothetical protein